MISGKVALGGLTLRFGESEKRFEELNRELEALTRAQRTLLEEEQGIIRALAETYLPELSANAVATGIADLRERLERALEEQEAHRRQIEAQLASIPEDVARRELIMAQAERAEEQAASALDEVRARVEEELGADDAHVQRVREHREIMERRSILKSRRTRLQAAAGVERRRYEGDRAFTYLQRRRFGEPEYRAGVFARWLDGWLARRIEYPLLSRNYRILRTGPSAIQREVRAISERAEELEQDIDAREQEAGERLGLHAALESEAAAQRALVDARSALTEARARHDRLAAEIRAVEANRGRPYENALHLHAEFLEARSIPELVVIARSTVDPRDDDLVGRLQDIRSRLDMIGRKLKPLRKELERQASRTTTVGELARTAASHFSSRRSLFPDDFELDDLLESVLEGLLPTEKAIARIEKSHRKRPLLAARSAPELNGWFGELSSRYDPELRAVRARYREHDDDDDDRDDEVVIYDDDGLVLRRRVRRRRRG